MIQELFGQEEQKKTCRELQHVKRYMERNTSKIICCLTAVGKNYNSTRDNKVPELEKTCKRRMANNKKGQKLFWYLCASNNLQRAIVNKDYEAAFKFLNEAEEQRTKYNYRIYKLFYCYYSALIYMGVGDKKSAKWNLDYVIQTGNCLSVKEKAEEMRKSMEESEI